MIRANTGIDLPFRAYPSSHSQESLRISFVFLEALIAAKGTVGDFDDQKKVSGAGMPFGIVPIRSSHEHQVRFRLATLQSNR